MTDERTEPWMDRRESGNSGLDLGTQRGRKFRIKKFESPIFYLATISGFLKRDQKLGLKFTQIFLKN